MTTYNWLPLPETVPLAEVIKRLNHVMSGTLQHDLDTALRRGVNSPAQLTADQNNYAIGSARVARLSSDAARTVTGFRGGVPNQELTVINVGSQNIVLAHQSASSEAANRFLLEAGANLTLTPDDAVTLYYDQATARWRNYALPVSSLSGTIAYAQLPTGSGSWDAGAGATTTITRALTVSGLLTASARILAQGTSPQIQMGGTTSSFPAVGQSGATLLFRLADNSAYCNVQGENATFNTGTFAGLLTASADANVAGTFTGRGGVYGTPNGVLGNVSAAHLGAQWTAITDKGLSISAPAGQTARLLELREGTTDRFFVTAAGAGTFSGLLTANASINVPTGQTYQFNGTQVVSAQGAAVADASGGATIDAEARTAINTLLARLRVHGLIAT